MFVTLLELLALVILISIFYRAAIIGLRVRASQIMMNEEEPYARDTENTEKTLLVIGDSTGVGVGADTPEDSVAGRLATHMQATHTENYSVSGALVEELPEQIRKAKLASYDRILVQIGGNDIMMFHDAKNIGKKLAAILRTLPNTKQTYVMSAGNVGGATVFPFIIRPFHTWANQAFHKSFARACLATGNRYINLYEPPSRDLFRKEPDRYLSADGLHPSSEGYGLWFEKLKEKLD